MAAPPSVANEQSPATKAASASYDISPRPSPSGLSPAPASKTPPGRGNHSQAARPSSASAQHSQPPATPGQSSPKLLSSSPPQAVCTPQAKGASQAKMVPNTQAKAPQQHSAAEQAFPVLNEAPHTSAALASAQQLKQQQHHQPHLQRHQQLFQPQQAEHQSHLQQQQPQQQQLLHQQPEQQPQLQMSSLGNVQADPVVRLVSHRSSSRAPPPGFAGSIGAPSGQPLQHASHAEGNRRRVSLHA